MKWFLIFIVALIPVFSNAATESATGVVSKIYTYSNGNVLFVGFNFPNASCNNTNGFVVPGDHPHVDKYLSILLAAKAMSAQVTVTAKIDDCWYPYLTDTGEATFFFID